MFYVLVQIVYHDVVLCLFQHYKKVMSDFVKDDHEHSLSVRNVLQFKGSPTTNWFVFYLLSISLELIMGMKDMTIFLNFKKINDKMSSINEPLYIL